MREHAPRALPSPLAVCAAVLALALTSCSAAGEFSRGVHDGIGDKLAPSPQLDAQAVTARLAELIPSVQAGVVYTAENDPNRLLGRPNGYTSKTAFTDSRIDPKRLESAAADAIERGGSGEVYDDPALAQARMAYLQELGKGVPMWGEYDYLADGVLVRVTNELTPDQDADYERALAQIVEERWSEHRSSSMPEISIAAHRLPASPPGGGCRVQRRSEPSVQPSRHATNRGTSVPR